MMIRYKNLRSLAKESFKLRTLTDVTKSNITVPLFVDTGGDNGCSPGRKDLHSPTHSHVIIGSEDKMAP